MPTLLETNLYRIWVAKQTAKGTPIATGAMTKSPRLAAGSVALAADSGTENISDGTQFGDIITFLNSITAGGQPGMQGDTDLLAYWLWLFHGAETVSPAGTNEVQTITLTGVPTGGTISITYDGRTTTPIAFNATAATIQAALEALPNIGTAGVVAAGGPWPAAVTITFSGVSTQKRPHPNIGIGVNALTGGTTPTMTTVDTTPGVNATHTFTPSGNPGFWLTWCQTLGANTVQRQKHNDGRVGGLTIEASTGAKVLRVTPNLLFSDPGEIYTVDPTPAMSTYPVLVYTEGQGAYTIDGQVFTGHTQFQLSLDLALAFVFGDATTPFDMARGNAAATIGATVAMDDTMLARWNTWVYGLAAPTAGTKPLQRIPPLGSYAVNLTKKDSAANTIGSLVGTFPGVQWEIPDAAGPAPDTGSTEVGLTGRLQKLTGQQLYTLAVGNQQAAYTA